MYVYLSLSLSLSLSIYIYIYIYIYTHIHTYTYTAPYESSGLVVSSRKEKGHLLYGDLAMISPTIVS